MKLVESTRCPELVGKFKAVLALAMGEPTEEKVDGVINEFYAGAETALYGLIYGDDVFGVIGIRRLSDEEVEILHIAVDERSRRRGLGRRMLNEMLAKERVHTLVAETDRDAVGFYQKCGFAVEPLGEKYPGVDRFRCRLQT